MKRYQGGGNTVQLRNIKACRLIFAHAEELDDIATQTEVKLEPSDEFITVVSQKEIKF